MLRTGQLHRAPPRRRDLARRRGPRYRGPWRLPGPDSHRLAAVNLRSATPSTSLLSRRPSYWTHIPRESGLAALVLRDGGVASVLCRSGPPGASQAGVEGDGVGVQVLVDQVEVGAEHGEQLLPEGLDPGGIAGSVR
jgi:hypothetical protein